MVAPKVTLQIVGVWGLAFSRVGAVCLHDPILESHVWKIFMTNKKTTVGS